MRPIPLAAAMLAVCLPLASQAQTAPLVQSAVLVAVVNEIPTPGGTPGALIDRGTLASVPRYRAVPDLLRKYLTIVEGDFGGAHLFASRAAANAWFSEAWRARVITTYGSPATVTSYDVPVVLDNADVPPSTVAAR